MYELKHMKNDTQNNANVAAIIIQLSELHWTKRTYCTSLSNAHSEL